MTGELACAAEARNAAAERRWSGRTATSWLDDQHDERSARMHRRDSTRHSSCAMKAAEFRYLQRAEAGAADSAPGRCVQRARPGSLQTHYRHGHGFGAGIHSPPRRKLRCPGRSAGMNKTGGTSLIKGRREGRSRQRAAKRPVAAAAAIRQLADELGIDRTLAQYNVLTSGSRLWGSKSPAWPFPSVLKTACCSYR